MQRWRISHLKQYLRSKLHARRGYVKYWGARVYFTDGSSLYQRLMDTGSHEPEVVRALISLTRSGTWAFDIGANIGLMAIPILTAKKDVKVVSLEPSPAAFGRLWLTHSASDDKDRWIIVNKAVDEKAGVVVFHEGVNGADSGSGIIDTGRAGLTRRIEVPAVTLDSLWDDLSRPDVSLIKIDVEGAEMRVLAGGGQCIRECRPMIVTEWWPANFAVYGDAPDRLLTFARDNGYRVFSVRSLGSVADEEVLALHHQMGHEDFVLVPTNRH